jgi:hypothetical protein
MGDIEHFNVICFLCDYLADVVKIHHMKKLNNIYSGALLIALGLVFYVYAIRKGGFPESDLVNMSFVWGPLAVFGTAGFLTLNKKRPLLLSISWGIWSVVMLFVFFVIIWPML